MIGRGILANPFLAESIKGIVINQNLLNRFKFYDQHNNDLFQSDSLKHDRLKNFHDDLFANYKKIFSGPGHLIGRMKGFWNYLGPGCFKESKKPLKSILKSNSIDRYQDMVEKIFHHKLSI